MHRNRRNYWSQIEFSLACSFTLFVIYFQQSIDMTKELQIHPSHFQKNIHFWNIGALQHSFCMKLAIDRIIAGHINHCKIILSKRISIISIRNKPKFTTQVIEVLPIKKKKRIKILVGYYHLPKMPLWEVKKQFFEQWKRCPSE